MSFASVGTYVGCRFGFYVRSCLLRIINLPRFSQFKKKKSVELKTQRKGTQLLLRFPFSGSLFSLFRTISTKRWAKKCKRAFSAKILWQIVSISSPQLIAFSNWPLRAKTVSAICRRVQVKFPLCRPLMRDSGMNHFRLWWIRTLFWQQMSRAVRLGICILEYESSAQRKMFQIIIKKFIIPKSSNGFLFTIYILI